MFEWLFKYPAVRFGEGQLGFSWAPRVELVLLIVAALFALAWWLYARETRLDHAPRRRTLLTALRCVGLLLVLITVLGPELRLRKRDDHRGIIAVGVDVSRSMSLPSADQSGKVSRLQRAKDLVLGKEGISDKLATAGDVRLYAFGNSARQVQAEELPALAADDDNTRVAGAIKEIVQLAHGLPLDSIVLLTDGVDTSAADPVAMARYAASRGAAVHTIGLGQRAGGPDVKLLAVKAPRHAQLGTLVEFTALVDRGPVTEPLELKLFQEQTLLKTEAIPQSSSAEPIQVRMSFVPEKEGTARMRLEIPPAAGEKILENNTYEFQVEVEEKRVEVLYVEGSPRHEYAFIRRAMWDNRHFKVVTLLRLGKGRFYYKGDDDSVLSKGFPETAEALGRFKAVILSDIEAAFFTPQQLALIADFVKVRGGGLLMLGGVNSFNLGGYQGTAVAGVLPVTFEGTGASATFDDTEFSFQITEDGASHEILKLTGDTAENGAQWALMPPLRGFNPVFGVKPGARVLAVHSTGAANPTPLPAAEAAASRKPVLLAVQDVGAGRTAAFAPANSWRWRMLRKADDDAFRRFWAQMIRWLAVGSKEFLAVSTDSAVGGVRQPVTITAQVLDKAHRPFNEAKVIAHVKDPFGNAEELNLPWALSEDGVYQAVFRPTEKGEYSIAVDANVGATKLEGAASFMAIESSAEFLRPALDAAALEGIAKAGGGTVDLDGKAERAVASILSAAKQRQTVLEVVEEHELWDAPILLLALACVWIVEWVLRKRSGLA
ncbi:MAG TPA: glutamine amidotransferase [Planctomycetota bacterium]|jgi:uncharacterized membrane protein